VVYRRVRLSDFGGDLLLDRVVVVVAANAESARRVRRTFRRRATHGHHRPTDLRFPGRTVRQSTRLQEPLQGGCSGVIRNLVCGGEGEYTFLANVNGRYRYFYQNVGSKKKVFEEDLLANDNLIRMY